MTGERPTFSIIIPTFSRPRQLGACLAAVSGLNYPRDLFEVIVVDDGSQTSPEDEIEAVKDQLPVTLIVQDHAGPAVARNTGAAHAQGEFLAFTDDDCAPTPDWLNAFAGGLMADPQRALGGRTINALPDNPYSTASQELLTNLYAYYNSDKDNARFFASNNLAVPARAFQALGGFEPTFPFAAGEDRDFCARWLNQRSGMTYIAEALVYHSHRLTFRSYWKQQFNYGRGAYHFYKLHAARTHSAARLQPAALYLRLLIHPFSVALGRRMGWRVAWLTVMSQAATAAGYYQERQLERRPGRTGHSYTAS